jgi:hypothetical protein
MTIQLFIIISIIIFFILRGICVLFVLLKILSKFVRRKLNNLGNCTSDTDIILEEARFESLYLQDILTKSSIDILKLSFIIDGNRWVTEEQLEYLYD